MEPGLEIITDNTTDFDLGGLYAPVCKAVLAAFDAAGARQSGEVCVTFVTDAEIRELNKKYRKIDAATDVLSFPMTDDPRACYLADGIIWGDIVISCETSAAQAEALGHSAARETAFLAAHGALHLLGFDHMTEEDEEVMTRLQRGIMQRIFNHESRA